MRIPGPFHNDRSQDNISIPLLSVEVDEGISITEWSSEISGEFESFESANSFDIEYVYGEIIEGWEIQKLLDITIELDEEGYYIASENKFNVYGEGKTRDEAIEDYVTSLADFYELLEHDVYERGANISTKNLFSFLQEYIRRTANGHD